jgi:two-component system LytT family response regulator
MNLQCLIVDDEPLARKGLAEDIRETGFIEIAGMAENAAQAAAILSSAQIDLVLLDIEMPGLSGLDFIKTLPSPPLVIITTAYPEYAVESFNLDVIDYLLKPFSFSRLLKACSKAKEFLELKQGVLAGKQPGKDYFFIKCNGRYEKIFLKELLFVEAADNYVNIHTTEKCFLTYQTLKSMQACLPATDFIKVHKSYIVAVGKISYIKGHFIFINDQHIPISRNFRDTVFQRVLEDKILRR